MKRLAAFLVLVALLCASQIEVASDLTAWAEPSLKAPLGADEFGRNHLLVLVVALGRSLGLGALLTGLVIGIATVLAWIISNDRDSLVAIILRAFSLLVESVPLLFWVMLGFVIFPERGLLIASLALLVGTVPVVTTVLSDEFGRLRQQPYVLVSRLSGTTRTKVLVRHILPNATAVLAPLAIQIMGIAVAIPGAIGILGYGRRTDMDLGMILLRGKENALAHPHILLWAVIAFSALYGVIFVLLRPLDTKLEKIKTEIAAML